MFFFSFTTCAYYYHRLLDVVIVTQLSKSHSRFIGSVFFLISLLSSIAIIMVPNYSSLVHSQNTLTSISMGNRWFNHQMNGLGSDGRLWHVLNSNIISATERLGQFNYRFLIFGLIQPIFQIIREHHGVCNTLWPAVLIALNPLTHWKTPIFIN